MLSRLVAALHRWAESGWAGAATATWELFQSAILPGPSGVVFFPLAIADPRRAPRLAVWGLAGAVVGGCIAYAIGAHAFDALGRPMLSALGVGEAKIVASEAAFARHGWWLVFLSTITPLSTKLTCEIGIVTLDCGDDGRELAKNGERDVVDLEHVRDSLRATREVRGQEPHAAERRAAQGWRSHRRALAAAWP